MGVHTENARKLVSNLQREWAVRDLNDEIRRLGLVKKSSNYAPEMNDVEAAVRILYEALERY